MSKKDIDKKENRLNILDLKLNGDKIKLETRPELKSNLLSQDQCRPLSAIPSLSLYSKDTYNFNVLSRRPYSAGELLYKPSSKDDEFLSAEAGATSLESLDEERSLPSSQIFKDLISEPIQSYKSNPENLRNSVLEHRNEVNSFDSYNPLQAAEKNEQYTDCPLTPGLTSKPPLPKKSDNKCKNKGGSKDNNLLNNDEIELIRLKTLKFEEDSLKKYERNDLNEEVIFKLEEIKSEKDFHTFLERRQNDIEKSVNAQFNTSYAEDEDLRLLDKVADNMDSSKTRYELLSHREASDNMKSPDILTSKSDSEIITSQDLHFKNWLAEDGHVEKNVSKSEERTDSFLKNLKSQHGEIDKCINKAQQILDKSKRLNAKPTTSSEENKVNLQDEKDDLDLKFEKFFQEPPKNIDKAPKKILKNHHTNCSDTKVNKSCSNQKKKEKLNSINETRKNKLTYIEKFDNSSRNDVATECQEEESWMSKFACDDKEECDDSKENLGAPNFNSTAINTHMDDNSTKVTQWLQDDIKCNGRNRNFLDILENVEDLDAVTRVADQEILELPHQNNETKTGLTESNTYDDIVQILKVLEAVDRKSQMKMESIKDIVNQELCNQDNQNETKHAGQNIPQIIITDTSSRTSSAVSRSSDQGLGSTSSLNSYASNYKEILSFLDEVDRNSLQTLSCAKERVQQVAKVVQNAICLDTIPKHEDLMPLDNRELCDQIIDLNLRLKDKSSSIKLLQDELSAARDQVLNLTKQSEDITKQKMKVQKDEHEAIVKRHQKFIDQLINDKKTLNQQCESLIAEIKMLEDRYNSNMKALEHKHQVELKKVKEMHMAGEKIRRERWIDTKTQKIKELTVKSLEPELQSMTLRHQQEITDLRALHTKELEDLELKAARKTQQQCEALRQQLTEEREKALAHEREIVRQRYEKLVETEEKGYQEQRRRLQQEHANRLMELEERQNSATTERDKAIKQAQEEFDDKLQTAIRRHNNEIKLLKETISMETEAWKNNYRKQQAIQIIEKEAKMRDQFKKERDREIEEVIERLESEANETKVQIEQATESRIRRIREKFENEIRDLEQSEKQTNAKYTETKSKLLESEDTIIALRANVKLLEKQLKENREVLSKMTDERSQLKDIVRKEMKQDLSSLEKEVARLKEEKDKELQQVYSRVKLAVAKKDEVLSELTRDHAALQEKCVYLESMLEQQRKEYLIK